MRTIAIANQKGGCGKTTTAINLSACLAVRDRDVLLIDLDPQSHASIGLNVQVQDLDGSVYDLFAEADARSLDEVILTVNDHFDLAPSQLILSAAEQQLAGRMGRESVVRDALRCVAEPRPSSPIRCSVAGGGRRWLVPLQRRRRTRWVGSETPCGVTCGSGASA